jgi:hypothetical protein
MAAQHDRARRAPGAAGSHTSTRPLYSPVTTRPSSRTTTTFTWPSWRPSSACCAAASMTPTGSS